MQDLQLGDTHLERTHLGSCSLCRGPADKSQSRDSGHTAVCQHGDVTAARLSEGVWTSGQGAGVSPAPHLSLGDAGSSEGTAADSRGGADGQLSPGLSNRGGTLGGNHHSCCLRGAGRTPPRQSLSSCGSCFSSIPPSSTLCLWQHVTKPLSCTVPFEVT